MLFNKRNLPEIKSRDFFNLELVVLHAMANTFSETDRAKLKGQLKWKPNKRFIGYPKSALSEFYEKNFDDTPSELRFDNKEEHRIGRMKLICNGTKYYCQFFATGGVLFDISWKPKPSKADLHTSEIEIVEIKRK